MKIERLIGADTLNERHLGMGIVSHDECMSILEHYEVARGPGMTIGEFIHELTLVNIRERGELMWLRPFSLDLHFDETVV